MMVWKFWLSLKKTNLLMSKNVSFLLNISEKFIAQKRSQVLKFSSLKFFFHGYGVRRLLSYMGMLNKYNGKIGMWHKWQFSCYKTVYIIVFFPNNTSLVSPLLDIKSYKQKYNIKKQATMLFVSGIPLI